MGLCRARLPKRRHDKTRRQRFVRLAHPSLPRWFPCLSWLLPWARCFGAEFRASATSCDSSRLTLGWPAPADLPLRDKRAWRPLGRADGPPSSRQRRLHRIARAPYDEAGGKYEAAVLRCHAMQLVSTVTSQLRAWGPVQAAPERRRGMRALRGGGRVATGAPGQPGVLGHSSAQSTGIHWNPPCGYQP